MNNTANLLAERTLALLAANRIASGLSVWLSHVRAAPRAGMRLRCVR
jgi:hypothetical protein